MKLPHFLNPPDSLIRPYFNIFSPVSGEDQAF